MRYVPIVAAVLVLLLVPASLRAADVTDVPPGVSTEAVKAFKRGLELHKAKQWTAAIKEYERALALGGRFPEAFNNLAYCYRKIGLVDKSIELYKVAIALRPTFVQAHDYLARAYLAKGDRAGALHEYEIVRRLDAKLAACLWAAIQRNDPDYHDMPWGSGAFILSSRPAA
ncbi:MAG: tetratricopeptide repeat protein [Armatimonadetes bacterium]|nr:tetratricopeptide repeat protein [Armatimonadota bacterium]